MTTKKTLICFDELDLFRISKIIELNNLFYAEHHGLLIKNKSDAIRKAIKECCERLIEKVRYAQGGQKTASE